MDIQQWMYEIDLNGLVYYIIKKRELSLLALTKLSHCNTLDDLERFARQHDAKVELGLAADVKVVLEKDFVNGAFL